MAAFPRRMTGVRKATRKGPSPGRRVIIVQMFCFGKGYFVRLHNVPKVRGDQLRPLNKTFGTISIYDKEQPRLETCGQVRGRVGRPRPNEFVLSLVSFECCRLWESV
jgi:hypothetical protein